ncbi:hypothetical protein K2P97_06835 [bacterium]|nr:hypothetical protein [bacterium]
MYRIRFRFKIGIPLTINEPSTEFVFFNYTVKVSGETDKNISQSTWLIFNIHGLPSYDEAVIISKKLKKAVEYSSVFNRIGVVSGLDLPTSGLAPAIKEQIKTDHGFETRDNIHGIDIFEDKKEVRIIQFNGTGTVTINPVSFFEDIQNLPSNTDFKSNSADEIAILMNYALFNSDPVAKIVFSISAVEQIGQKEDWTEIQKCKITELIKFVNDDATISQPERDELIESLNRTFKISLRGGVKKLLAQLNIPHLIKNWDALYSKRSELVHGLAPKAGVDYSELSHMAVSLCGFILLKKLEAELKIQPRAKYDRYIV